ncbi:MAG: 30S ribosomal protein S4, partial [Patescibacteria group bacterium]|nr:30S ribosomal protein S4 [Patescibacteria group bacterium]
MARHIGPKSRKSRRVLTRLFPKDDKILAKRNFPPGMHSNARRRISGYGTQLLEKQKAKWMYGVLERQFRRYYARAAKNKGQTGFLLLQYLETRFDNVIYRMGMAQTRPQARQLASHGFFLVNGHPVNIPSYEVKSGDEIRVRPSRVSSKYIQNQMAYLAKYKGPDWLTFDNKEMKGRVLSLPQQADFEASGCR